MKVKKPPSPHRLSTIFRELEKASHAQPLTFASLVLFLGDQSHGFLTLFLTLPFVLPLSIPGMSVPFGIVISTVMGAWILDLPPWLPKFLRNKPISPGMVRRICHYGQKLFSKLEFIVRPRLEFLFDTAVIRFLLGLIIFLSAVFLALPLPPGTNFPPSLVMFILSMSIIERDGLLAILGVAIFCLEFYVFWEVIQFLLIRFGSDVSWLESVLSFFPPTIV